MASNTVFDSLVTTLSSHERRDMLERIRASVVLDDEPVDRELEPAESDVAFAYGTMSLPQKILVFLRMLFRGISREEAVERTLLGRLSSRLQSQASHLIRVGDDVFLPDFKAELIKLKENASFSSGPVSRVQSIGLDAFYAFVLGLESPELQDELVSGTDPFRMSENGNVDDEPTLRKEAEGRLADRLGNISPWITERMQGDAAFFEGLTVLVNFDFDEVLAPFEAAPGEEGEHCDVERLRGPLTRLGGVLKGLERAPSGALLQGLVLFGSHAAQQEELEGYLQQRVSGLQSRLDVIRGFARRIPFYDILRYASGDLGLQLPDGPNGRGWRARVERFWSRRVEELFQLYSFERKKREFLEEASEIAEDEVRPMRGYPSVSGVSVGVHASSLGVLASLVRQLSRDRSTRTLKTLFVQGSFYKENNRAEFNEYYNEIGDLKNALDVFESRLAEGGDLAASLSEARGPTESGDEHDFETDGAPDRVSVVARIDEEADRLARRGIELFHGLSETLRGVLYGEVGGRYDTLSNFDEVAGMENGEFKDRLDDVLQLCKAASDVLSRIYDMEKQSARRRAAVEHRSG